MSFFKKNIAIFTLLGVITIHAVILLKLVYFPYPELFIYPYLTNQGLVPYQQIFDQHFPGLMFLPINFNNLGMVTPEIARIWSLGVVLIIHLLLFFIAKKLFKNSIAALIPNILFLLLHPFLEGWVLWIDSFMPLFLLPAFYFSYQSVLTGTKKHLFLSGLFLGLAIVWKQQAIPITGLVFIYLLFFIRDFKKLFIYILGVLPAPILMVVYIVAVGAFKDFWYWAVTFNLTTFAQYGRKLPTSTVESWTLFKRVLFIYFPTVLLPFIKNHRLGVLLAIFIVGGWSGDIARFDPVHFQVSLPFLVLGISLLMKEFWQKRIAKLVIILFLFPIIYWQINFYKGHIDNKVYFFDSETLQVRDAITQRTEPSDEVFLLGPVAHLYQMTDTIPAGRIFVFQFPWFLMVSENRFVEALDNSKPKLVVRDRTIVIEGRKITDFARKLDEYISLHYDVTYMIGNIEVMELKR